MDALFLAGHPALDFLNTSLAPKGVATELIGDGRSFVDWLLRANLLAPQDADKALQQFGSAALDRAAASARKLRDWADVWIARWRDVADSDCRTELLRLNDLLAGACRSRELLLTTHGLQLRDRVAIDDADQLVALVATQIAELVSTEERALVKRCSGVACTLWFLDRTKAHRRLYCSTTVCGNRAKVAAFRERQRAS